MFKGVTCPPMHSPQWAILMKSVNNDAKLAYKIWLENGEAFPETVESRYAKSPEAWDNSSHEKKVENVVSKISILLNDQIKALSYKKENKKAEYLMKQYQLLLEQFQLNISELSILSTIVTANTMLNSFDNWIDKLESSDNPYHSLDIIIKTLDNLNILTKISDDDYKEYFENQDAYFISKRIDFTFNDFNEAKMALNAAIRKIPQVKEKALDLAKKKQVTAIKPYLKRVYSFWEREAELIFLNQLKSPGNAYSKMDKKTLANAKKEFIQQQMIAWRELIDADLESQSYKILSQVEDISSAELWILSPKDMNNDLVAYIVEKLDKEDYNTSQLLDDANRDMEKYHNAYINYFKPLSNKHEDVYAPFLIKNEYFLSLKEILFNKKDSNSKDKLYDNPIQNIKLEDWRKLLTSIGVNKDAIFADITGEVADKITEGIAIERIFFDKIEKGTQHIFLVPDMEEEYLAFKTKYKDTPVMEFYNYLLSVRNSTNKLLPNFSKLQNGKLPSIEMSSIDALYQNGIVTNMFGTFKNTFKVTNRDLDVLPKDLVKEHKKYNNIPIRYRGPIKNQSLDLPTLFLLDYHNAVNYRSKLTLSATLDLLKTTIGESEVVVRDHYSNMFKLKSSSELYRKAEDVPETISGRESNLYKLVESLIDQRVFGIEMEGNQQWNKNIKNFKGWVSKTNMALNPFSAISNTAHGQFMLLFESLGTETGYYTANDLRKAHSKTWSDMPSVLADINNNVHKSKTNLLFDLMNIKDDVLPNEYANDNLLKKLADKSPLMALSHGSEFINKAISLYSVLTNIKVLTANGEFIDSEGKITTDRSKAVSIDEALEVKDGKLEWKFSNIAKTEKTDNLDMFAVSRMVKRIARGQFGNQANPENKALAERYWYGSLAYHMRGWVIPFWRRHFNGITSAKVRREDLTQEQLSYNFETNQFEEGIYTTAVRFLTGAIRDIRSKDGFSLSANYKSLMDSEKKNLHFAGAQLASAALFFILFNIFYYDDDDEPTDDPTDLFLALSARRVYSELISFTHFGELYRTFTTPAVSTSYGKSVLDAFEQLLSGPTEIYDTGIRKGEYKLKRRISKLVPVWNQLEKDVKEQIEYLIK